MASLALLPRPITISPLDDEPTPYTRLPTSDARDSPLPAVRAPRRCPPPPAPATPEPEPVRRSPPAPALPAEIAPGMLADGSRTARDPAVRGFLAEPRPRADDPRLADGAVRALAALATARAPAHPAHLVFWDGTREDKERTARWLHELLQVQPPVIRPPVAWLGAPEELWLVRHLQELYALSREFAPRVLRKRSRTGGRSSAAGAGADADGEPAPPGAKRRRTAGSAAARRSSPAPPPSRASSSSLSSLPPSPRSAADALPAADAPPAPTRARSASTGSSSTACSDGSERTRVARSPPPVHKSKPLPEEADARAALRARSARVRPAPPSPQPPPRARRATRVR